MSLKPDRIISELKSIVHPSSGENIIDLGMVRNLSVEGTRIKFDLNFPTANDPLKSSLKKACEKFLTRHFKDITEVDIQIVTPVKSTTENKKPILPGVKNIIAVASGKGGVGKSTIAANLAVAISKAGASTGLIDADIYGPSIPKMMGVEDERPVAGSKNGKQVLIPVEKYGVRILSIGFFIQKEDATIWRGPMASNAFKQLITDTDWGDLDYLIVDLPPGTSDIHLTLVQTVPVTGVVIVSTPQEVALADVIKGINMFRNPDINVPVLGVIENMAWFTPEELPQNRYYIFGKDGCANLAKKMNVPLLGQIPIIQAIREGGDKGIPFLAQHNIVNQAFDDIVANIMIQIRQRNENIQPTNVVKIKKK